MSPTIITAAVGLAAAVAAYAYGRHDGRQLAEGEQALADRLVERTAIAAREEAASAIASIKVRHTTVHNQLEREVRNVPVYSDPACRVPASGMRDLNAAIAGEGPQPSHPELPASGASR